MSDESGRPRPSRGFFAILGEYLGNLRRLGLRRIVRGLREILRELLGEGVLQLVAALLACGAAFAIVWGFRHHPAGTGAVVGPVACLVLLGAVLVVRTTRAGEPPPLGKLGVAAVVTFGVVALLFFTAVTSDCIAC